MMPRTWSHFGFSIDEEKQWTHAHIHNPFLAVCLEASGLTAKDMLEMKTSKIWKRASVWVLWQLTCNNAAPGQGMTSETGVMRPMALPPSRFAR